MSPGQRPSLSVVLKKKIIKINNPQVTVHKRCVNDEQQPCLMIDHSYKFKKGSLWGSFMWNHRWWLPNTNYVPDHQSGVQLVQTERHCGCWDAISSVRHINRQRAQVCCCHNLSGQLWTAVDKRNITAEEIGRAHV